jgi:SAM-dependent methyltransferase
LTSPDHNNPWKRLYALHHARRFRWLSDQIAGLEKDRVSILELGCGDARSLDHIPVPIDRYVGFDAGMGSGSIDGKTCGLEAARQRFAHHKNVRLQQSAHPSDVAALQEKFDVAIVMETFEYLGTANLEAYVSILANSLQPDGILLATMPNEKGLPLLIKALGAKLSGIPRSQFTATEFLNALLGRIERVSRVERGRKGFDYEMIAHLVGRKFRYVHLESIVSLNLPLAFSPNIGLIASHELIGCSAKSRSQRSNGNPGTCLAAAQLP